MQRLVLIVSAVAAFYSAPALAYCSGRDPTWPGYNADFYTVQSEFKRAKYVAMVKVEREIWLGEDGKPRPLRPPFRSGISRPWGMDPYIGAFYEVGLVKAYKGRPARHLRLYSENTTARFWLEPSREYLVFLSEQNFDAPVGTALTIDSCGNSPVLRRDAGSLLLQLRRF